MGFWAIDSKYLQNHKLQIESRRRVSIKNRDRVVFFKRSYHNISFYFTGTVEASELVSTDSEYLYRCHISATEQLEHPINLDFFKYSLLKVYRYGQPEKHFRRPYLRLTENDFLTLIRGEIFWPRTAFGIFAEKLDREQLYRFVRELATKSPDLFFERSEINTAWTELKHFIMSEFVSAGELLTQIKRKVNDIKSNGRDIPFAELAIG